MPRSATGKKREKRNEGVTNQAIKAVLDEKMPLRVVSRLYKIPLMTLSDIIRKKKANPEYTPLNATQVVFNAQQEKELCSYIVRASKWSFGLTLEGVQKLAYELAKKNNLKYPESWNVNQKAGEGWLRGFRCRYGSMLSLRKPEAISLGRMASFNKPNVELFFDKLSQIYGRQEWSPFRIWNVDETGCSTVHVPPRVLACKQDRQVSSATSGERGQNVTLIGAISAGGTYIPPAMIFPRVNFKDHMTLGAPPGTLGLASPTGWSNEKLFVAFLDHFIKFVQPSVTNKVLLIIDNHETHLSIEAITAARNNGVIFLTFPPHTSHKLQPLDRTVFGPFKTFLNKHTKEWMLANPGKPVSIYDVAGLVGKAFPMAFTPVNVLSGFKSTGIWPIDSGIFEDHEFLPSELTNRPYEPSSCPQPRLLKDDVVSEVLEPEVGVRTPELKKNPPVTEKYVSPKEIRPFPRAPPRKVSRRGRKPGKCRIATDTPEKLQIEGLKPCKVKKSLDFTRTEDLEQESEFLDESSSSDESVTNFFDVKPNVRVNSWALVEFQIKNSRTTTLTHYVGKVVEIGENDTVLVSFLRKKSKTFAFPSVLDVSNIPLVDIRKILPDPVERRGHYHFLAIKFLFKQLNLR